MAVIGQAPGELATLQAFVNTLDIEQSTDELSTPAALDQWLQAAGLAGTDSGGQVFPPSGPADLAAAIELREALRAVLLVHAPHPQAEAMHPGAAGQAAAVARLAGVAAAAQARIVVRADGSVDAGHRGWFSSSAGVQMRPGDAIVVPLNTERLPGLVVWQAITTILYNIAIATAEARTI